MRSIRESVRFCDPDASPQIQCSRFTVIPRCGGRVLDVGLAMTTNVAGLYVISVQTDDCREYEGVFEVRQNEVGTKCVRAVYAMEINK